RAPRARAGPLPPPARSLRLEIPDDLAQRRSRDCAGDAARLRDRAAAPGNRLRGLRRSGSRPVPEGRRGMNKERRLSGLLLLLESAVFAWLILSHRLPRGHDTLGLYLQQYLFLAQAVQSHSVALWMPNTAHGLVTNLTAGCQGGLLQNVLLLVGGVPEGTNHLP